MSARDLSEKHIETPKGSVSKLRIFLVFAAAMCLYAIVSLARNETLLLAILVLLTVLEIVRLITHLSKSTRLQALCEAIWFLVLLSVFLGVYRHSLMDHGLFVFATIFYRGYYTLYCNVRLAFAISLMIMIAVLPITCGIVTDPGFAELLTAAYAVLVASLWAFCSKLGAMVFGFSPAVETDDKTK